MLGMFVPGRWLIAGAALLLTGPLPGAAQDPPDPATAPKPAAAEGDVSGPQEENPQTPAPGTTDAPAPKDPEGTSAGPAEDSAEPGPPAPPPPEDCDLSRIESFDFCRLCESWIEKEDLNEKGEHLECGRKPEKAEACLKTYWVCESCGAESRAPGECETCRQSRTEQTSQARIVFRCRECGLWKDQPGQCELEDCPAKGRDRERSCEYSGGFPHIPLK